MWAARDSVHETGRHRGVLWQHLPDFCMVRSFERVEQQGLNHPRFPNRPNSRPSPPLFLREISNEPNRTPGTDPAAFWAGGEIFFEAVVPFGSKIGIVSGSAGRRQGISKTRCRSLVGFSFFYIKFQMNKRLLSGLPSNFRGCETSPFSAAAPLRGGDFPCVVGKCRLTFFYPIATNPTTSGGTGRRRNESGRDTDIFSMSFPFPAFLIRHPSVFHSAESFGSPQGSRISNGSSNLPEDRRHWQSFRRRRLFP